MQKEKQGQITSIKDLADAFNKDYNISVNEGIFVVYLNDDNTISKQTFFDVSENLDSSIFLRSIIKQLPDEIHKIAIMTNSSDKSMNNIVGAYMNLSFIANFLNFKIIQAAEIVNDPSRDAPYFMNFKTSENEYLDLPFE